MSKKSGNLDSDLRCLSHNGNFVRSNRSKTIRGIHKPKDFVIILGSVFIGLALACLTVDSPISGIIGLSLGAVLAVSVLLRKTEYLIFSWVFLTASMWIILLRLLPAYYYAIAGRGIFWGLLVCAIAAWAMDNALRGRQFTRFDNVAFKALILVFMLWCALSLLTSIDPLNSVKKWAHFVIALFASYMFYDFFSRDVNNIKKFLVVISIVVTIVSLVTVVVATRCLILGMPVYKEISLWFFNPNVLGNFLFGCCPILITSGFDFGPIKRLRFYFVCLLLLALFFSFHRASWLAVLVSGTFLLWKAGGKLSLITVMIAGLFITSLTFPLWGVDFYGHITGPLYTGRKELWHASWNTACDYPLLGVGLGNSVEAIEKYIDTIWMQGTATHNVYLRNAVDMGFMSAVLLLVFYVMFLYSSWKIERSLKSHYLRLVVRGSMASFLGLFVHGMFGNFGILTCFDAADFTVLMPYILMALPFAAKKLEERAEFGAV